MTEDELRAALAARGYELRRDNRKRWGEQSYLTGKGKHHRREPGYMVTDAQDVIVCGEWYRASLGDVEAFLGQLEADSEPASVKGCPPAGRRQ